MPGGARRGREISSGQVVKVGTEWNGEVGNKFLPIPPTE